ncbi:MAG: hypothetical protein EOM65_14480, partial [Synergistales bacterium]|nr:hypothetical protein [Synergistales bacterium]
MCVAMRKIIVAPGANGCLSAEDVRASQALFEGARAALFQLEVPLDAVLEGLRLAKTHEALTILTPAPWRELPRELLALVDVLVPNAIELSQCAGTANREKAFAHLLDLGVGAVVIASLFEEQIRLGHDKLEDLLMGFDSREQSEISLFPGMAYAGPEEHLDWVVKARKALSIPVIASLNAVTAETWVEWARRLADTGIDALELNFYSTPVDSSKAGASIENEQVEAVAAVCRVLSIPVSVKLSPFYANPLHVMRRMAEAGAKGFVLFNRFFQPDIDAETERPSFVFDLSEAEESRLPLRFTALANGRVKADLVASTAVLTAGDVAKMILAGARAVQMVTAFYRNGIDYGQKVLAEFASWM